MQVQCYVKQTVGFRHRIANMRSEDYFDYRIAKDEAVFILADGAGSKEYARESAKCVAECTIRLFENGLLDGCFRNGQLFKTLNGSLFQLRLPIENLGTTAIIVYVKQDRLFIGHIGDGVVISDLDGDFRALSAPENGNTPWKTFLLPCSNVTSMHFRVTERSLPLECVLIAATDGVAVHLYDDDTKEVAQACDVIKQWLIDLPGDEVDQLLSENMNEVFDGMNIDDKTIAVIKIIRD